MQSVNTSEDIIHNSALVLLSDDSSDRGNNVCNSKPALSACVLSTQSRAFNLKLGATLSLRDRPGVRTECAQSLCTDRKKPLSLKGLQIQSRTPSRIFQTVCGTPSEASGERSQYEHFVSLNTTTITDCLWRASEALELLRLQCNLGAACVHFATFWLLERLQSERRALKDKLSFSFAHGLNTVTR